MKHLVRSLSRNRFVQGSFLFTASNVLVGFLNYLFNVGAGRALGPEGYSDIVALFAYVTIFSIPVGVLTTFLIQKMGAADDVKGYAAAAHAWLLEKVRRWWFLFALTLFVTPFLPRLTNLTPAAAYVLPFIILLAFMAAFYNGALQGLHLFLWFSIITIIAAIVKLIGAGAALWWMNEVYIVIIFLVISNVIYVLMSQMVFSKEIRSNNPRPLLFSKRIRDIFKDKQLWYTIGMTGALALLNNADIIYVKKMLPADEAGIYSAWSLYAKIMLFALGPLLTMSFIFFSSKMYQKFHQVVFILSLVFLALVGFALMILYGLYARSLIDIMFGPQYRSLFPYLEWAAFFGTGYVMMMFINNYYLAYKSKLSLLPAVLFPFYLVALFLYADQIVEVMYLNTLYTFIATALFLLVFFKDRFVHLIKLFRS